VPLASVDTSLSLSLPSTASIDNEENSVVSKVLVDISLSSFASLSSAAEPKVRSERNRKNPHSFAPSKESAITTDEDEPQEKKVHSPRSPQEQNEFLGGPMNRSRSEERLNGSAANPQRKESDSISSPLSITQVQKGNSAERI
jgi:hypothetical protein